MKAFNAGALKGRKATIERIKQFKPSSRKRKGDDAGELKPLPVMVGLAVNELQVGQPGQTLRLFFTNTGTSSIPAIGDPYFEVAFVPFMPTSGSDVGPPGALTTASAIGQFTLSAPQTGGSTWQATPNPEATVPYWRFTPTAGTLLGTGSNATMVYDFNGVTADVAGVTNANIRYGGAEGFASGSVVLPIIKNPVVNQPSPVIETFTVTPLTIDLAAGDAPQVEIAFSVSGAVSVAIPAANFVSPTATCGQPITVPVNRSTTFELIAINQTGQMVSQFISVKVTPSALDVLPRGTIMMWNGSEDALPDGWLLCNGQVMSDGTNAPDLTERFVVGAGNLYQAGVSYEPSSHTHQYTPGAPTFVSYMDHQHVFHVYDPADWSSNSATGSPAGNHTHTFHINSADTTSVGEQTPASTALTFVVKQV